MLDVAVAGKLHEPAVLEQQTRRMLADSKARALVTNFGGQWLYLRELKNARPETTGFSENLRQSLRRETEMLLESIVREDRSVIDLLNADYTFVDETLARHYGIPSVRGSRFRRVAVTDEARRGLLGHGSFLLVTSVANRTSPVSRGKWVLENLLGVAPPLPPPNVPAIDESPKPPRHRRCVRRWRSIAGTRRAPRATGSWTRSASRSRTSTWSDDGGRDGNAPIDATSELFDGTPLDGPVSRGTRCSRARCVRANGHREADDIRHRAGAEVLRYAGGAPDRPRCGDERLSFLVTRARHRQERAVSDEDEIEIGTVGRVLLFRTRRVHKQDPACGNWSRTWLS